MTAQNSTFAGQLKHFAQSVDIVDDTIFDQVRDLVCKYVTNELRGQYFELLREENPDGEQQPYLRTFWSSEERVHTWPLRTPGDAFTNPVTAAVGQQRSMWLVGEDKSRWTRATAAQDLLVQDAGPVAVHPSPRRRSGRPSSCP